MNDLMTNLGLNTKILVGISLSANNLLELVCLDKSTKEITHYASAEVKYNNAIREIVDQEEFTDNLLNLFQQADLNPKNCDVWLNLPNVHFGFTNLDQSITDSEIPGALLSEVEDLYIFKKNDPLIEYSIIGKDQETGELYVAYSAIQQATIDLVKESFRSIGANLVSVETANTALLKGIQYSECFKYGFDSTNILLITSNSYSIFNIRNNILISYYEEPLAIKSFSNEEVYSAIASAASTTLAKYNSENLLIISETDEISSELLASKVDFDGNISILDRNKYTTGCFIRIKAETAINQSQIPMISIEVVGTAATLYEDYILSFNYIHDGKVQDYETINILGFELNFAKYAMVVITTGIIIAILLYVIISSYLNAQDKGIQNEIRRIDNNIGSLQDQINLNNQRKTSQTIFAVAQKIQQTNMKDFDILSALSADIPPSVWIEEFMLASDSYITISGKALSSSEIQEFFTNLKRRDDSLGLDKLDYEDNSEYINDIYSFEMSNDALPPTSMDGGMNNTNEGAQQQNSNNDPMMNFDMGPSVPQM